MSDLLDSVTLVGSHISCSQEYRLQRFKQRLYPIDDLKYLCLNHLQ